MLDFKTTTAHYAVNTDVFWTAMAGHLVTPHDALVKASLKELAIAQDFLKAHLPGHIQSRINFETLRLTDGEFVLPELKKIHSDILYQCLS